MEQKSTTDIEIKFDIFKQNSAFKKMIKSKFYESILTTIKGSGYNISTILTSDREMFNKFYIVLSTGSSTINVDQVFMKLEDPINKRFIENFLASYICEVIIEILNIRISEYTKYADGQATIKLDQMKVIKNILSTVMFSHLSDIYAGRGRFSSWENMDLQGFLSIYTELPGFIPVLVMIGNKEIKLRTYVEGPPIPMGYKGKVTAQSRDLNIYYELFNIVSTQLLKSNRKLPIEFNHIFTLDIISKDYRKVLMKYNKERNFVKLRADYAVNNINNFSKIILFDFTTKSNEYIQEIRSEMERKVIGYIDSSAFEQSINEYFTKKNELDATTILQSGSTSIPSMPRISPRQSNLSIFISSIPYNRIIASNSGIYADRFSLKNKYSDVKLLTNTTLFTNFNNQILGNSSSNIDTFYDDLNSKTESSVSKVEDYLIGYLATIIIQAINQDIKNKTNNKFVINKIRSIKSDLYESIKIALIEIYRSNDTMMWKRTNLTKFLTEYNKVREISGLFKIYLGDIEISRKVEYKRVIRSKAVQRPINLYENLYNIFTIEVTNIDRNIKPSVISILSILLFLEKYTTKVPTQTIIGEQNYTNYVNSLKMEMSIYVNDMLYTQSSTSNSSKVLRNTIKQMLEYYKVIEPYEYDEEDEDVYDDCKGTSTNMYTIIFVSLLLILLIVVLANSKWKRL